MGIFGLVEGSEAAAVVRRTQRALRAERVVGVVRARRSAEFVPVAQSAADAAVALFADKPSFRSIGDLLPPLSSAIGDVGYLGRQANRRVAQGMEVLALAQPQHVHIAPGRRAAVVAGTARVISPPVAAPVSRLDKGVVLAPVRSPVVPKGVRRLSVHRVVSAAERLPVEDDPLIEPFSPVVRPVVKPAVKPSVAPSRDRLRDLSLRGDIDFSPRLASGEPCVDRPVRRVGKAARPVVGSAPAVRRKFVPWCD
uniref:Uncharacterized protein n=1 Tax=uncultured prokaryote TaxID=198431 RepID=A0A0H5Q5B7_9ZZZZ|nr:hypothetical protein [uncultured prokaryote]